MLHGSWWVLQAIWRRASDTRACLEQGQNHQSSADHNLWWVYSILQEHELHEQDLVCRCMQALGNTWSQIQEQNSTNWSQLCHWLIQRDIWHMTEHGPEGSREEVRLVHKNSAWVQIETPWSISSVLGHDLLHCQRVLLRDKHSCGQGSSVHRNQWVLDSQPNEGILECNQLWESHAEGAQPKFRADSSCQ